MKTTLTILAILAAFSAGAALADDDCDVPMADWRPRESVMRLAERNGWSVREFDIDDVGYEIEGRDRDGREIEVKLDPATLEIVDMEYEDDDDRESSRNPTPAGTVEPPRNGLFGNGAPPQVEVN